MSKNFQSARFLNKAAAAMLGLIVFCIASSVSAGEISRWDFDSDAGGWTGNGQTELNVKEGLLHVRSNGNDPFFSAAVAGQSGQHQLTIRAKFKDRADVQVFWTTAKSPNTSEEMSVRAEYSGNPDEMKTLRLWFQTDSPVTSLRIDPMSRAGEMLIDSIVLTDDAPPAPEATPVADIRVPQGFKVELLYSVPGGEMGSWVSMTTDPKGRLIVSDQYGKLYRITLAEAGSSESPVIEPIDVEIGMAQGLQYAFGGLYVMVNGTNKDAQGLYKVTDSDGDDKLDMAEHLRLIDGGGEHGPHAVILAPDGKSLYVCAGNHTNPTDFSTSRVPRNWGEDQLLPRMWDAGGHAVGKMAPGGWIAKVSPDGKEWELVASGFRNEYDIAFNADGELFTYDADMEWDVGSPWYRPTRVNHVTSGAEFGWRSGTGKWPVWYPDSLGSVVDIGPGSPTGIAFGTGAGFPAKYQKALFISDWSYGVIYAVHLTPSGSTYVGEAEPFISAAPLPVTDIVVNPRDQAMYFTIGGRRTQSGLYRVTYTGPESTAPAAAAESTGADLRSIRHKLEDLHVNASSDAVVEALKWLGHPDRSIRFAARIALEQQPVASWQEQALNENTNADAKLTALLALARCGDASVQSGLLESLGQLDGASLSSDQKLAAIRVVSLAFIRMGRPSDDLAHAVANILNSIYPSEDIRLNRELCAMLVYLNGDQVADKTLKLLRDASTQEEQIHFAMCLRVLNRDQWTLEQRKEYFQWFVTAANLRGGNSFSGFLKNFREEAIATLSEQDKTALKEVLDIRPESTEPVVEAASRPFVRAWAVDDLLTEVEDGLKGRNFENGRRMFTVTACYKCHRFAGSGGIVGPDLTAVARRYNARTMLESLIEPSKVISDQYEASVFVLNNGKQVIGRVVNLNADKLMISENMLDPGRLTSISRDEIEESFVSKVSMMATGLLNNLSREEILDLVAYLQSAGNPDAAAFKQPRVLRRAVLPVN